MSLFFSRLAKAKLHHHASYFKRKIRLLYFQRLIEVPQTIYQISIDDQRYRKGQSSDFSNQQTILDKKNQLAIDSLFNEYDTYIGIKLVGEKFNSTMWAVIQHSNKEMMNKYLPVVQKATADKELDVTAFKMLIDRYYGLAYGYQIFGSQSGFGFELVDKNKRLQIMEKHGIE